MINDYSSVENAIIGESVTLGRRVTIESHCLIGDMAIIEDGLTLAQHVSVCPSKIVKQSILTSHVCT